MNDHCPYWAMIGHAPSVNRLYPSVGTHELQSSRSEASPPKIAFGLALCCYNYDMLSNSTYLYMLFTLSFLFFSVPINHEIHFFSTSNPMLSSIRNDIYWTGLIFFTL